MITTFSININLVSENNIFYKYQSGFRNNHSTDLFLSFLSNKILKGFDNGVYTDMILIDLQKVFDTINHKIMLEKLLPIGFSKNTIIGMNHIYQKVTLL